MQRWGRPTATRRWSADGALDVVVVGGGPTGVESAGALIELYRADLAKDYPRLCQAHPRVTLVEAGPALFSTFTPGCARTPGGRWRRGVGVLLGERVAAWRRRGATLASGRVLPAHTVVWGAGLQAHPLAASLGLALQRGRRVRRARPERPRPPGGVRRRRPRVDRGRGGGALPQLGSVALQAGEHAGATIARRAVGGPAPFGYADKGSMAAIGRGTAVVQLRRGRTLTGPAAMLTGAWCTWALLPSGEDRVKALVSWIWAGFTRERTARITVRTDET